MSKREAIVPPARHALYDAHRYSAAIRSGDLLFVSGQRGQTWAVIASLVEICKLNGVNPQAYLCDVISRIVGGHPQSRLDDLLPWADPTILGLKAAA